MQLDEIFKNNIYIPEEDLKEKIWQKILKRERQKAKVKIMIFSVLGFGSLAGFVPMLRILLSDFTQSGFYEYLSLLFAKEAAFVRQEVALSLAESLPTLHLLFVLGIIFIFTLSIRFILKQIINNRMARGYALS